MRSTCSSVRVLVERRLDGERLGESEERELGMHLPECAECRAFAADLRFILDIVERLPRQMAPQDLQVRIMEQIPERTSAPALRIGWLQRLGWAWAPVAGMAGVLLLIYHTMIAPGVSLLTLPQAISEWAAMISMADLGSLVNATSLLSWSVGVEMFLALALVLVGVFGVMAHVLTRQPAALLATRH